MFSLKKNQIHVNKMLRREREQSIMKIATDSSICICLKAMTFCFLSSSDSCSASANSLIALSRWCRMSSHKALIDSRSLSILSRSLNAWSRRFFEFSISFIRSVKKYFYLKKNKHNFLTSNQKIKVTFYFISKHFVFVIRFNIDIVLNNFIN